MSSHATKRMPLVSVITAAYNAADTIQSAIYSVRNQSYTRWEHIIVDDGSQDRTPQMLAELVAQDSRAKFYRQKNAGPAAARNKALEIAKGQLIAILDADDIAQPDRLEKQVYFLSAHSKVAVLGGAAIAVSDSGRICGYMQRPESHEELVSRIYKECPFIHSTVIYRREFFEALGGYAEDLRRCQDYDLWLRGYRFWRFHNLKEALISYRIPRIRIRDAFSSSRARLRAIRRDGVLLSHSWYALRPILATLFYILMSKQRRYGEIPHNSTKV